MRPWRQFRLLLRVSRSRQIARRYLVVNGFDGALASLGVIMGFLAAGPVEVATALHACIGLAVALMMSGVSSAYVSEAAERRRELAELRDAMLSDIDASAHVRAASLVPWFVAAVNGLAPLLAVLLVASPLWLHLQGVALPLAPLESAVIVAFAVLFLLGLFLARVSGEFWLRSAARTVLVALLTAGLILLLAP